MPSTIIQDLYLYPVKSLAGVKVDQIDFNAFGPIDDRRYMLVDHKHRFLTQRSHSVLSQFTLQKTANGWMVFSPKGQSILIEADSDSDDIIETSVWKTLLKTREVSKKVSQWFSEQIDEMVLLVEFDDLETRYKQILDHSAPFKFADGYPLLVCNSESLNDLNQRVNVAMDMLRFRPNVVVSLPAQSEYQVAKLVNASNGSLIFAEPCVRCNVPAIDPKTSVFQRELFIQLKKNSHKPIKPFLG